MRRSPPMAELQGLEAGVRPSLPLIENREEEDDGGLRLPGGSGTPLAAERHGVTVATMSDADDRDEEIRVHDRVEDPVIASPKAVLSPHQRVSEPLAVAGQSRGPQYGPRGVAAKHLQGLRPGGE